MRNNGRYNNMQISRKCRRQRRTYANQRSGNELREYRTKQRDLILGVFSYAGYVTADEIYKALFPEVNKSTVYRNLEKLTESGKITRELSKDGSKSIYRLNLTARCEGHLHLVCSRCGGVIHLSEADSEKLGRALKEDYGFAVNDTATIISGVCESCSKDNRKN